MSDTFREQLVTRYRAATLRVTKDELHEVMKEYDRLATERERAQRALAVFGEARIALKGGTLCNICPLRPECWDDGGTGCVLRVLVPAARRLGILPEDKES